LHPVIIPILLFLILNFSLFALFSIRLINVKIILIIQLPHIYYYMGEYSKVTDIPCFNDIIFPSHFLQKRTFFEIPGINMECLLILHCFYCLFLFYGIVNSFVSCQNSHFTILNTQFFSFCSLFHSINKCKNYFNSTTFAYLLVSSSFFMEFFCCIIILILLYSICR